MLDSRGVDIEKLQARSLDDPHRNRVALEQQAERLGGVPVIGDIGPDKDLFPISGDMLVVANPPQVADILFDIGITMVEEVHSSLNPRFGAGRVPIGKAAYLFAGVAIE